MEDVLLYSTLMTVKRARSVLWVLCVLAMAGAQVFGLVQGYLCVCHDDPIVISSDHCHSEDNPIAESVEFVACDRELEDCEHSQPSKERREHAVQKEAIKGRTVDSPRVVIADLLNLVVSMLPPIEDLRTQRPQGVHERASADAAPPDHGRRSSQWVATVAMRI